MAVPKTAALPLGDSPITDLREGPGYYSKAYLFFEAQNVRDLLINAVAGEPSVLRICFDVAPSTAVFIEI